MRLCELPHATSSIVGSTRRIALAVSAASRAYSVAVLCPICHGPSTSLPRHHSLMPYGSAAPLLRRRSDHWVPEGWLQYSTRLRAASTPRVPRFTAIIGSLPTMRDQLVNSSTPTWFVSSERQARSSRVGRWSRGPTPSSHVYPETKLPPGYRRMGTPRSRARPATSARKPSASAV